MGHFLGTAKQMEVEEIFVQRCGKIHPVGGGEVT